MNNQNSSPTQPVHWLLRSLIFGLIIACFSIYRAFPSDVLAYAVIIVFLACAYKICDRKSVFVIIFAICGAILGLTSPKALASIVSLITSAAGGAALLTSKRGSVIYIGAIAAALAAALTISPSSETAIQILTPLPAAIVLAVCSRKKATRVSAICAVSATLIAVWLIPLAISVYTTYGGDVGSFIESTKSAYTSTFVEAFELFSSSLEVKLFESISKEILVATAELIFALIPSIVIAIANIISFMITGLNAIIRCTQCGGINIREASFRLSSVSAWIYIISLLAIIFSFGSSRSAEVLALSMANVNIILTPAFVLVGAAASISKARHKKGSGVFRIIITVIAFMYVGVLVLYPIALYGATTTLKLNRIKPFINTKE